MSFQVTARYIKGTLDYANAFIILSEVRFGVSQTATPEPGSIALFASLGLTGAAFLRRKKFRG